MSQYIYLVTWMIVFSVSTPCPDVYQRKSDEFGRGNNGFQSMSVCAVAHFKTVREPAKKVFGKNERDSAFAFYNRAVKECSSKQFSFLSNERIESVRIDSIKINNNNDLTK